MKISKLLFPDKCPFCGKRIDNNESVCCPACQCAGVLRQEIAQRDLSALPQILHLYCPILYAGNGKESLIRYKFNGENWLANPFAMLLHQQILKQNGYAHCQWITAVPISAARYRKRGYNQSALVAKKLSVLSGIPYREFLVRKETRNPHQTGKMNRMERYQANRFECTMQTLEISGGVLLVDDILTTGSTLNECAGLLLDAGADFVSAAVIASGRRDLGGVCA